MKKKRISILSIFSLIILTTVALSTAKATNQEECPACPGEGAEDNPCTENPFTKWIKLYPSKTTLMPGETFELKIDWYRTCWCPSDYFKIFYKNEVTGEITEAGRHAEPYWTMCMSYCTETYTQTLIAPSEPGTYTVKVIHASGHGEWWCGYYDINWNCPRADGGFLGHKPEELSWDFYEIAAQFTITVEPEKWSFAIITDLHIGFDIPDYDGDSYDDTLLCEDPNRECDYYLTKRLEAIVNRIIELKDGYNIKFVPVLGDISDTAEYSELLKARNILNKLNDPDGDGDLTDGIPYIPLIGNHDVWPYTQKEGIDPDIRGEENWATIAASAIGDQYFEGIFWCSFDTLAEPREECLAKNKNPQKILDLFGEFSRQENKDFPSLQNYAFSYKGINFISLDQVEIARERKPGYLEIEPQSQFITTAWLNYKLSEYKDKPIILFSHDPWFWDNKFDKLSEKYLLFAGHVHDRRCNDNITDTSDLFCERIIAKSRLGAIPTEAILEEYREEPERNIGVIRIVEVKDVEKPMREDIDYSIIKGIPEEIALDEIKRPDPYIIYSPENPAPNENVAFIINDELRGKEIKSCKWDFGDGTTDNSRNCKVSHSYSPFILWRYTVKVTITYLDDTQRIAEKSFWVLPKFKLKVPEFIIPNLLVDETVNVAETPQNTPASVSLFKEIDGLKIPIGIINVHFEKVGEK